MSVTREEILATILKKIDDNKGTLAVDWPGGAFDTASVDEWIAPDVSAVVPARVRENEQELTVLLIVNCFAKRSTNLYRHVEIADTVAGWFHQTNLDILDAGGETIRFQEAEIRIVPQTVPSDEALRQVAVSVTGKLIAAFGPVITGVSSGLAARCLVSGYSFGDAERGAALIEVWDTTIPGWSDAVTASTWADGAIQTNVNYSDWGGLVTKFRVTNWAGNRDIIEYS